MNFLDHVDVLVLAWNEEANLARTLDALKPFPRVVVLDSGSTDATIAIAQGFHNVRICSRAFDNHANQWNHGLRECGLHSEWVLALDADYVLDRGLVDEIAVLAPDASVQGYRARFRYCIQGRPLTASLYPPVVALYRRTAGTYAQEGHTQRLRIEGRLDELRGLVSHDDRKPLADWLAAQDRYARLECDLLLGTPWPRLGWRDRLRRLLVVTPWLVPLYCLTVGRGFLDGRAGLFYAMQRGIAEAILSLRLIEAGIAGRPKP